MSLTPDCINPVMGKHPNHYGDNYGGWCLECSNAGADTLAEQLVASRAEVERLKNDNGFAQRIMEAIRKYANGDKEALGGMGVPWVDELIAACDSLRARLDAAVEREKALVGGLEPFAKYAKCKAFSCPQVLAKAFVDAEELYDRIAPTPQTVAERKEPQA